MTRHVGEISNVRDNAAASSSFLVRGLLYAAVLLLDLAGGITFGWHFALGGAAGGVTAFVWLWVEAR